MDRKDFAGCLMMIAGAKMKTLTDHQMESWWDLALMHPEIPLESWRAGAVKLASSPGDWPTFDKFLEEALEDVYGEEQDAQAAWDNIKAAAKVWYSGIETQCRLAREMLNPSELAAAETIGWETIQRISPENKTIIFGQFRKMWESKSAQVKRTLAIPEQARPKQRIELDRKSIEAVAKNLTVDN